MSNVEDFYQPFMPAKEHASEFAEHLLESMDGSSSSTRKDVKTVFGFSVGENNFLLEEGLVTELVALPSYTEVPNTPDHFIGLANVRGNIVPFYTIHTMLNYQRKNNAAIEYGLQVGEGVNAAMLMIDEKPRGISLDTLQPSGNMSSMHVKIRPFIQQFFTDQNTLWGLVDIYGLFSFISREEIALTID